MCRLESESRAELKLSREAASEQRRVLRIEGSIAVGELARQLGSKAPDVQRKLMALGTMVSINQSIARVAPSAVPIWMAIFAPARRIAATASVDGRPHENCTIGAPASSASCRVAGSERSR